MTMHEHQWVTMTSGRGGFVHAERCVDCGDERLRKGGAAIPPAAELPSALLFGIAFLVGLLGVLGAAAILAVAGAFG